MSENPVRDLLDQIPRTEKIDQVARPLRQAAEKIAETPGLSEALAALRPLQDDGLVQCPPGTIRATPRGRALLRVIAMCFDRYLGQPTEAARYSRAI